MTTPSFHPITSHMNTIQLYLNDQLVTIRGETSTIKKLNEDDHYLANYINRAAKAGQFHFLFAHDPNLRRIVVKRVPTNYGGVPVWSKNPSESDRAATLQLLKLRNKYASRFQDGARIWEEIANEMKMAGFDVDGDKCARKFLQLTQSYRRSCHCDEGIETSEEICGELRKIFEWREESEDEDWSGGKRKRTGSGEENEEFLRKIMRNSELKEAHFKEMCALLRRRNELLEEKLKQNREIISILGELVKK